MLKLSYDSLEAIPENLRGAYIVEGTKYVLDQLSADHPVIVHNAVVLSDKVKATNKVAELSSELEAAKSTSVPRGHVVVAKADAELLEKIKTHGSADEVVTKLNEHATLKQSTESRTRADHLREVAKELSYEPEAFVRLPGLPEFEIREVNGIKTVIAKVKAGDTITEKPASEYVEASADLAPFLPALKADSKGGVRVHGSSPTGGKPAPDMFEKIRKQTKASEDARKQPASVSERFGIKQATA